MALFEHCTRDLLNITAPRRMGVLRPLKVVIENYPEGESEMVEAQNHPQNPDMGTRQVPFGRELYVEHDDFMEDPPRKFFRLAPGREVRLRYAYFVTCQEVVKGDNGEVVALRCTYDPKTKGGNAPDGRKVKATLHWVSAEHGVPAEVRLYDHLFRCEHPGAEGDFLDDLNPSSLTVESSIVEPVLGNLELGAVVQFERQGYFCVDADTTVDARVFNRTVALRDSWSKAKKK